jgi:hypothetical protein
VVNGQSQEEQRMYDDLTLVVGLEGFRFTGVREQEDELDFEIVLVARAGVCPLCKRASVEVKERPLVRVRELPVAGGTTTLVWHTRCFHYRCCRRSFSEWHDELASRQRVSARFRRHLFGRPRSGAAHAEMANDEQTSRYQGVEVAFLLGAAGKLAEGSRAPLTRRRALDAAAHRRGSQALATIVSDPDGRRVRPRSPGRIEVPPRG